MVSHRENVGFASEVWRQQKRETKDVLPRPQSVVLSWLRSTEAQVGDKHSLH